MTPPRPFKTLHLTNAWHPTSGGVRAVYRTMLGAANRLERPMRLVIPGPVHAVEDVGRFGRIYYVQAPRAFAVDSRYRLIMPTRYLLPWVTGLRQILDQEQPDIVEICDKYSLPYVAGLLRKRWLRCRAPRPTVVGTSAERMDDAVETFLSSSEVARSSVRWFMRSVYAPMFDYHVANSHYTADELRSVLPAHRQHVVHVSPPGVSGDAFRRLPGGDTRQSLMELTRGDSRTRLLVYVGRLSREKNLGLLVEMMEHLMAGEIAGETNFRLLLAGDGPERPMLEAARARLRGHVALLGNLPGGQAVRRLLASADVFVHPNPREPFGLAPLEAMAAELPVVAPDSGGVLSYADDTTAWLAKPTGAAFATAVRNVIEQPVRASMRARVALERAATFHEDLVVPRFFSLLDTLHDQRLQAQAAATPDFIAGTLTGRAATSR
ncbi:MAG: glycosyltransferase [Vicinamibacterales bacterium]